MLEGGILEGSNAAIWTTSTIHGSRIRAFTTNVAPASTAWPTALKAILIPFYVATPVTFLEMFFTSGTTPGTANFDLGIYADDFNRIVSLGSTACVNTTDAIQPAGGGAINPTTLGRGRYYMTMVAAATTITTRANVNGNGFFRALGCKQAVLGSVVLPATITPAAHTDNYLPQVGMATVNNVL